MNRRDNITGWRPFQADLKSPHVWITNPIRWDHVVFWVISFVLLIQVGTINRSGMLDYENYINYFRETDLNWFINFFSSQKNNLSLLFGFFTEEFLWRIWALTLGLFFSEEQSVLVTVLLLNFLIILALSKTSRPLFGILLWILIPPALATIGTFQIRQGFSFAILLYMTLSLRRPILGCFIAATIHTTFAIILVYSLIFKVFKNQSIRLLIIYLLVSLLLTIIGNQLFHDYGGRRAEQYSIQEGAASINYVIGSLICSESSFIYLIQSKKKLTLITELAAVHIGCIFFIVFSWFFLPIGTSRNGYFALLFLMVIIPEIQKRNYFTWSLWGLTLIYLTYIIMKAYFVDGDYDELLQAW